MRRAIREYRRTVLLLGAPILMGAASLASHAQAAGTLSVTTLSSRPEFVSGGDALVEVKVPQGTQSSDLGVLLNDRDVTAQFAATGEGTFRGLVTGLREGENLIDATLNVAGHPEARLKITNYPITGPILSGPHLTPVRVPHGRIRTRRTARCQLFGEAQDRVLLSDVGQHVQAALPEGGSARRTS